MSKGRRALFICLITFIVMTAWGRSLVQSQERSQPEPASQKVIAYLYPIELKRGDVITDGGGGRPFRIESDTLFIWVDLMPDADFAHPTKYIFIRDDQSAPVLVKDGNWPPYLNGHMVLYGGLNKSSLASPWQLDGIKVHLYPLELKAGNVVSDGPMGTSWKIEDDTLFLWVDLMPGARFVHPTRHVFIRGNPKEPVLVAKGEWWPCLNGQSILYGNRNQGTVISPFVLLTAAIDQTD